MGLECRLTIHAGEHDRRNCPVTADLPWSYAEARGAELRDAKTKKVIPCQVEGKRRGLALTWVAKGLKAGERQKLVVKALAKAEAAPIVVLTDKRDPCRVDVDIHGKPFTSYLYGTQWVRPFLFPVLGPGGAQVTRSWPITDALRGEKTDHVHHRSIWVAHGECGKVDNWSEEEGHGWQRHRSFLKKASGSVFGQIVAKNDWCTNAGRKQFEETRDLRFYALPGGTRLFDIAVTFRMSEKEVTFRDTKEGGLMSVRVASSMDVSAGGKIQNGYGGINEAETWGKNAPWCDYSGMVGKNHVGIAIMDHETNPRYPTEWHVRDYGLMTANCFAWRHYRPEAKRRGDMTFPKGSSTTWRYRLYIHRGDAGAGKVGAHFMDFISPPRVTLK